MEIFNKDMKINYWVIFDKKQAKIVDYFKISPES